MKCGQELGGVPSRVRDPERAEKIVSAAAELFAERGYHTVSLADIGQASGIVGSGIYRHFESKHAVLLAIVENPMIDLLERSDRIVDEHTDSVTTLRQLIKTQIDFCLDSRNVVLLYRQESHFLQDEHARRIRRLQRRYVENWIATQLELRPELDDATARTLVHSCIGAIQSVLTFDSGLSRTDLELTLVSMAERLLAADHTPRAHRDGS